MNQFDEILKKRAREEPFPLPQGYAGRVLQTCAALEEPKPRKRYPFRQVTWAAAVLALMIVVPNVSPAAAAAMADDAQTAVYCPQCGAEVDPHAIFCPGCGGKL